jgi:Zn-dependent protease
MQFYLGNIPVRIYPAFWVVIALIGFLSTTSVLGTFIWTIVILISVLFHEMGHALFGLLFKQHVSIELYGLGGATHRSGPPLKKWEEFFIVLAGPIFGFILAFFSKWLLSFVKQEGSVLWLALLIGYAVNLFWTCVNLIPVQPLDGGHLLRIVFEALFGFRGKKISLVISMILGALGGIAFMALQMFLAGAIFFLLAFENFRTFQSILGSTQKDEDASLQLKLKKAIFEKEHGHSDVAILELSQIREETQKGLLFSAATEELAMLLSDKGEQKRAWDLLESLGNQLSFEAMRLKMELAYKRGEYKTAIGLGNSLYQTSQGGDIALLVARCHAREGEADAAKGWLDRARQDGIAGIDAAIASADFDQIRREL